MAPGLCRCHHHLCSEQLRRRCWTFAELPSELPNERPSCMMRDASWAWAAPALLYCCPAAITAAMQRSKWKLSSLL